MGKIDYSIMRKTGTFIGINYWKAHAIGSVRAKKDSVWIKNLHLLK